ncbi:MAG: ornithine cyclodeaminase family protein [Acidimicrobiales bacterium]
MQDTIVVGRSGLIEVLDTVGVDVVLDALIDRLRSTIAEMEPDKLLTEDRHGFHYRKPDLGLVEWMPAMDTGRRVAIKTVGYHPSNPFQRGIPSVLGTIALYDCATGALEGIVEGTLVTALRTGAASAVVSDVLAPSRPLVVSVVGCGAQAVTQVHALSRVRNVSRVLAHDVVADVAASFPARLGRVIDVPVEVVPVDQQHRLLSEADVLCTATSVGIDEGPVVVGDVHKDDLHINAVGADFAGKLELPLGLLESALVVPDVRTQCVLEGECQQLRSDQIGPDMATLLQAPERFRDAADGLTVFDSTGWALEDMVAAELILELAREHDAAISIDVQTVGSDPFDPYEGVA